MNLSGLFGRSARRTPRRGAGRLDLVAKPLKRPQQPGPRGWAASGAGGVAYLQAPQRWRGTTVQVCGLWPFPVGSGAPMTGVPLGRALNSDATVCCDPISWFARSRLISNPSAFILGKPGLGKSSVVRRMALGLAGYGVQPLILGDLKPDYRDLIEALDGQVIDLAPGRGNLNVLDASDALAAADRLTGSARTWLINDARQRRANTISGLITILRAGTPPTDREESVITRALDILDDRMTGRVPVLADLLQVVKDAPPDLREAALDRGSEVRYREITEGLEATLQSLATGTSRFGMIFSEQTTQPMRRDKPVAFDLSGIDDGQFDLQAAALLACWSTGFAAVNVSQVLADAGLEPRRNYFVVLDELWRALRSGRGIVDRIDALTRLNRQRGVGQVMVSHTMSDLLALPTEEDRMKARGFVERAGMVICGGLPRAEMRLLSEAVRVADAEVDMITGWQDPPAWSSDEEDPTPPGLGNFLIKVGGRTGIPIHVDLTPVEHALNDTNKRWRDVPLSVVPDEILGDGAGGALEEVS
ncbi:ATP/GTP-binding protein [Kribbella sp. NPDC048928]|uniref:ATP/GTP-binding protein n=1 Tax=Kribbella sp. NPDC048928 TaxID=3364111 RepID=UPI00371EBF08